MYLKVKVSKGATLTLALGEDNTLILKAILGSVGIGLSGLLSYIGLVGIIVTCLGERKGYRVFGMCYKACELTLLILGVVGAIALG